MRILVYIAFTVLLFSCGRTNVEISNISGTNVGVHASNELKEYLGQIYSNVDFGMSVANTDADIQLLLSEQAIGLNIGELPTVKESFLITSKNERLYIIAPDERGLLNAVYALLEKQGCGFYIGGDVAPQPKKWNGFAGWEMEDTPILKDRTLFNWHNFLSGCTGWDAEEWKLWIDQANKMRYNGIMVHAYGNNPMFSYDYLGETKTTGYFNSSINGRDWGNQHINDVRRVIGGDLFDAAVYGAKPSLVEESEKVEAATHLMYDAFEYAEKCGTNVIFALDFDTWMSHPQNIVKKLPKDALFEINGHLTPNPEHPEGYKYYKHQVQELIKKYPQIDELTAWSRGASNKPNANLGTIWMAFPYKQFPTSWKKEYKQKLDQHPHIKDDLMAQGMFAFSKIVFAIKKAAAEVKPGLQIGYGSWTFSWLEQAHAFMPEGVAFRPLDARISFDTEVSKKALQSVGAKRDLYPIVWAHHDDFSYIGRPYAPFTNLTDMVKERKIGGLGIIHWTTHPLDMYFTGTSKQLWQATQNQSLQTTVNEYVQRRFGMEAKALSAYFYEWITKGPIFGRETSDHFIDLGKLHWKSLVKSWDALIPGAEKRIKMLDAVPEAQRNNYWQYQRGMEEFYISFFENHDKFSKAYDFAEEGNVTEAAKLMKGTKPEETVQKFLDAYQHIEYTEGERALVLSLNTRWVPDYNNLKQRLGLASVRIRFSPTMHDPLAQIPGVNTYHVDEKGLWWICLWEHELPGNKFVQDEGKSALQVDGTLNYKLKTMHGQTLSAGTYSLTLNADLQSEASCSILENGKKIAGITQNAGEPVKPVSFKSKGGDLVLKVKTAETMKLYRLEIVPKN